MEILPNDIKNIILQYKKIKYKLNCPNNLRRCKCKKCYIFNNIDDRENLYKLFLNKNLFSYNVYKFIELLKEGIDFEEIIDSSEYVNKFDKIHKYLFNKFMCYRIIMTHDYDCDCDRELLFFHMLYDLDLNLNYNFNDLATKVKKELKILKNM